MKRILATLLLVFSLLGAKAQLTYQHSYPSSYALSVVNLLLSGKKYCQYDYTSHQVVLYNLNHSVWKTIALPILPGLSEPYFNGFVSEDFFKIDHKVDMLVGYTDTGVTAGVSGHWVIIDETSGIIDRFDSTVGFEIHNIGLDSFVAFIEYRHTWITSVYSIPGTLPCNLCGGGLGLGMPTNNGSGNSSFMSEAIPNPSSEQTKIEYKIPRGATGTIRVYNAIGKEVKSYKVDSNFNYITLDNSELPSGTYYYNLNTGDGLTSTKKMVVIR